DPLFQFVWCSYTKAIGSSDNRNYCFANAMDASGNVYLTGMVDGTYPTTPGAYSGPGSVDPEIFVSKFSKDGTTLLYSTYISGSSDEMGLGIAVDASGQAYVVGHAMANWTGSNTYPTTSSAFQPAMYTYGGYDAILTVLNATGTGLVYSTYLGGSGDDEAYAIALGTSGLVYITGSTYSSGNTFPTKGTSIAAQQSAQGYHDVFVAKFNITLSGNSSLIYSIHLGGGGDDFGRSIAVNSAGNTFVTGRFQAISSPNFPTTSSVYSTTYSGGSDNMMVFVTKLSASTPVTYSYSTYLAPGIASGIAVNPSSGEAYIVGSTRTFSFPTTAGVLQDVHGQDGAGNPNGDAFVTKLNSTGAALIYSTFLGGSWSEGGTGIAVNSAGEAYVTGVALPEFPTSAGALQSNHATGGGDLDFFVVQLNSAASAYGCGGSTYIGGNDNDYGTMMYDYASPKISLRDHNGVNDTVSVSGTSHSTNFPTTSGSYGPTKLNGISDQPVFFKLTCVSSVLPVELIVFTGEVLDSKVKLTWQTASEFNNDFFTIEKSADGKTFLEMNQIDGAGTTTSPHDYFYWDENPYSGISYYRLKLTDFDGSFTYSNVVAVEVQSSNSFATTFYNSNENVIEIIFSGNEITVATIHLVSLAGKILKEEKFSSLERKISVKNLPAGIYLLEISSEGKKMVMKVPVMK
ncbi:MAG TPA: T9SS type A sorting domain-containing protein, partial [Chitinophagales bacterium]|nr:T9SS type A sorting domain-containing protein [Chitinophagales bacterium]